MILHDFAAARYVEAVPTDAPDLVVSAMGWAPAVT